MGEHKSKNRRFKEDRDGAWQRGVRPDAAVKAAQFKRWFIQMGGSFEPPVEEIPEGGTTAGV